MTLSPDALQRTAYDTGWLDDECRRLLEFGRGFPHPRGGSSWLDDDGAPDLSKPLHTWITARMAHVYSLGHLLGQPGAGELADLAVAGLTGPLRDRENGGWYPSLGPDGVPAEGKEAYGHAFVVLAAASATIAGRPGARALLDDALAVFDERFWDDAAGLCVDCWDSAFSTLDDYRGVNANMHAVEALLAAADATGDRRWSDRALRIADSVVGWARTNGWRVPEHFTPDWTPLPEHNVDRPDDPFQPYGATVGHALEWSRLLLHVEATLGGEAPPWLEPAARELFDRAVADGWHADGADGFVYTTDWDGRPVVHDRMHWVAAEAVAAAGALHRRTGDSRYAALEASWWGYVRTHLVDTERGSWHHQLDAHNHPVATVWPGKPDLYHAVQATLLARLPLAPGLAASLAAGALA